jgi:natural product precursor
MKTKKVSKRLTLNKETVSRLNGQDMKTVKGGTNYTVCTCPTGCEGTCDTGTSLPRC